MSQPRAAIWVDAPSKHLISSVSRTTQPSERVQMYSTFYPENGLS